MGEPLFPGRFIHHDRIHPALGGGFHQLHLTAFGSEVAGLKALVDDGLLEKVCYSSTPPRYEYHLTPRGRDFMAYLPGIISSPVALSTMIGSTRRWVAVSTSCI
jgi:hypothetical protein